MSKILKQPIFWLFIFSIGYFFTRIYHLTALPIFTDEAIYIRWAQIGGRDASWRFISLTDGKQPLFTWAMMGMLRLFSDPLFAGRITSVFAGYIGLIGIYFLGNELFRSKKVGIVASALFLFYPFQLILDRMALYDSLVSSLFIWTLYLIVLLARKNTLDMALLLGLTLGTAVLNKTSAFLSLYFLPIAFVLFDFSKKKRIFRIIRLLGYMGIVFVLSQALYSILRLSPYFYIIAQKDTIFVYSFREWLTHPYRFFLGNFHGLMSWLLDYMGKPMFIVSLASLVVFWKNPKEKFFLLFWWLSLFIALSFFGKVLYPRHILFMTMPLLVLASWTLVEIWEKIHFRLFPLIITLIAVVPMIVLSYAIVSNIKTAPITRSDRGQYVDDWPSGWGAKEVALYMKEAGKNEKVKIYTEGTFGLFPYALEMYLVDDKNVLIEGIWPLAKEMPETILANAKLMPTFFVTNQTQGKPWKHLSLIERYQKGTNVTSGMHLYRIVPELE